MMTSMYAYDVPDSEREELVPNLYEAAKQPFMGLTAFITDEPFLVVGKIKDSYILEDQFGLQTRVDFEFPWEAPRVASNRLVAASRTEASPFKDAGLLAYDSESGEWAVRVGRSDERFPLEERTAALEANGWRVADFDDNDVIVPVHGRCPNCGSDSLSYAEDEDDDGYKTNQNFKLESSADDPVVLCHACNQWCHESDLKTSDDSAGGNQNRTEAEEAPRPVSKVADVSQPFSFQGKGYISQHSSEGIAIMPEKQSPEEMAMMIGSLATPKEQMDEHVRNMNEEHGTRFPLHDNPFINRGGSFNKDALYPEHFTGGPFIVVAKWLTPEHTVMFHDETPGGRGTDRRLRGFVTELGGPGSHAFVVAQPLGVPVIVVRGGNQLDNIQPGDHLRINGTTGVVDVNGGDPNFVAQDPDAITISTPVYRFAYANGTGHVEEMVPGAMVGDKGGHGGMMGLLMESGHAQVDENFNHNMSFGFLCDDGKIIQDVNPIPDQEQFEQWAHQQEAALGLPQGAVERLDVAAYVPPKSTTIAPQIDENSTVPLTGVPQDTPVTAATTERVDDKKQEALTCPKCGSHTLESYHLDEKAGTGEFGCLTCGNTFKDDYRKKAATEEAGEVDKNKDYPAGAHQPGTRIEMVRPEMKGLKGTIVDWHSREAEPFKRHAYDIVLDNGKRYRGIYEDTFKKIKQASTEELESDTPPQWFIEELDRQLVESLHIAAPALRLDPEVINYAEMMAQSTDQSSDEICSELADKGLIKTEADWNAVDDAVNYVRSNSHLHNEDEYGEGRYAGLLDNIWMLKEKNDFSTWPAEKQQRAIENHPSGSMLDHLKVVQSTVQALDEGDIQTALYNANILAHNDVPGNPWKGMNAQDIIDRIQSSRTASLQKGAPYPENSYKNAPEHSPKKQKDWPAEVNAIYNACMREGNGRGDSKEEKQSSCAAIAWAQYKKTVKNKGHGNTKPDKESAWKEADLGGLLPHELYQQIYLAVVGTTFAATYGVDAVKNLVGKIKSGEPFEQAVNEVVPAEYQEEVLSAIDNRTYNEVDYPYTEHGKMPLAKVQLPEDVLTGVDGGRWGDDYEGHPVMCYMCGNTRSASLGSACEACGYPLLIRRDSPPRSENQWKEAALKGWTEDQGFYTKGDLRVIAGKDGWYIAKGWYTPEAHYLDAGPFESADHAMSFADSYGDKDVGIETEPPVWNKSSSLSVGEWYTMHSPDYKVPDVIHVQDVTEEGITASIEGDDKGLFPIHLKHEEIENEQYSFEPYTPKEASEENPYFLETTSMIKEARKDFTSSEQKELVNENPKARARNIHKLNLEGTHYPADLDEGDILSSTIYWW